MPGGSLILQIVTLRWEWKIIKSQTPHYQLPQWYVPSIYTKIKRQPPQYSMTGTRTTKTTTTAL